MFDLKRISAALGLLAASALTASAQTPAAGASVFEDRCAVCHGVNGGQGPNLKGVVGRKAASLPGFAYTPALKAAALVWTPATLDRFLTNPGKAVPGTAMVVRVTDPKQRADLIAYLATRR